MQDRSDRAQGVDADHQSVMGPRSRREAKGVRYWSRKGLLQSMNILAKAAITTAPAKSTIALSMLAACALPDRHGPCDGQGFTRQKLVIDHHGRPTG